MEQTEETETRTGAEKRSVNGEDSNGFALLVSVAPFLGVSCATFSSSGACLSKR